MNQIVGTKAATNAEGGGVGHGNTDLNCVLLTNRQARVALSQTWGLAWMGQSVRACVCTCVLVTVCVCHCALACVAMRVCTCVCLCVRAHSRPFRDNNHSRLCCKCWLHSLDPMTLFQP